MRAALCVALLLSLLGCSANAPEPGVPTARPAPSASSPAAPSPSPSPSQAAASETTAKVDTPLARRAGNSPPSLRRFHDALFGLQSGRRKQHVNIAWLGDSHGQADFWSGRLRSLLGARFGHGGPGFVHLGYKNYRHDDLKLEIRGRWRMRPKKPTHPQRQDDGVFGLGGLMMSGYADLPRVEFKLSGAVPGGSLRYDLCYRFQRKDDTLSVEVLGGTRKNLSVKDSPLGTVSHLEFSGPSDAPVFVTPRGRTDLCGMDAETDPQTHPGVVLDTLAINGARYGTMLAWDEDAWVGELARRAPSLVIFELGTNEAGDGKPRYDHVAEELAALLARARKAAPESDCLVISPTDRADAESRSEAMRKRLATQAEALGCFWFDAHQLLGGEGAMAKLREEPDPRVQPDGIHLTIKGYRGLGQSLFDALMSGY